MTGQNIINSFKVTGVYPFNREVICLAPGIDKREKYTLFKPEALAKRTGLAYIHLYSPSSKPKLESFASVTITSPDSVIGRESNVTEDSDSGEESSDDGMFYGSLVPKRTATNISEFLKLPEYQAGCLISIERTWDPF